MAVDDAWRHQGLNDFPARSNHYRSLSVLLLTLVVLEREFRTQHNQLRQDILQMATHNKPDFYVFTKAGKGENAPNRQIGAAWKHSKGDGIGIVLFATPVSGEIVLFPPIEDDNLTDF